MCFPVNSRVRLIATITRGLYCLVLLLLCENASAAISITDDTGSKLELDSPAQRIISLSPHITEMLFSIGAGDAIVGVVEYSDYPEAARKLPRVGRHNSLDLERIISLHPDIVIAWQSGNPIHQVEQLRKLGLKVYYSEPRHLESIAATLRQFGILTGKVEQSEAAADRFMQRYHKLLQDYRNRKPVTVFYQTWDQPLMTLNGEHIVNEVIELCGGKNIFADLHILSPTVTKEAVIAANPQVIVATSIVDSTGTELPQALSQWQQWPSIPAVQYGNLFVIHPDIIHRYTLRILEGVETLCGFLQQARGRIK